MKLLYVCIISVLYLYFASAARNFDDLRRQLMKNPRLRKDLIEAFAITTGKSLFSENIDYRGTLLDTIRNGQNLNPFGIEFTPSETIELIIRSFEEAPRPDVVTFSPYDKSNGDLPLFVTGLRAFKRIITRDAKINKKDLSLIAETTEGKVRGVRLREEGVEYIAFFNMPYARVGKRFMAPVPPKPWKGIRNSVKEKTFCPHRILGIQQIGGTEDCLDMNVIIPSPRAEGRPVFVWVHGGGFNFGMAGSYLYNPARIIKQGLVVVSFHYRLGALGFLSTGTKDAPGNAGMKDMVAALRWVKANIKNFGGDPDNITLYGVSSGAIAIEYLILSPMAKGLFHRAILSSGSVFNEWAYARDPLKYAFRLGKELGSNATHVKHLMRFLRKANPLQIVEAQEKIAMSDDPSGEFIPYVPCTENNFSGVENFLPDHPENLMKSGQYNHVPVIVTFNNQEGLQIISKIRSNPDYVASMERNLEYYLPRDILNGLNKPQHKLDILNRIRQFYFKGERVSNKTIGAVVDLVSDTKFLLGVYNSIKLRSRLNQEEIFYGQFAYDGHLNVFKYNYDIGVRGAAHADDLGYVFKLPFEGLYRENNATTILVTERMVTMLGNFAKYGNPTPVRSELLPVTWYPIQSGNTYDYLEITDTLQMKQNPYQQRYQFWDQLYQYKKELIYRDGVHTTD